MKYKVEPTSERDLSREETLEVMKHIEDQKFETMLKNQRLIQARQISPHMFGQVMMLEKMKAFDELALNKGIEEGDITAAFKKYNLENDEDYKKMIEESKAKLPNQKPQ